MKFDILTIFPHIFDSYLSESILKRAREMEKIEIETHNIREFTSDKHKTTDDIPYGGGAGMVMKVEPIYRALQTLIGDQWQINNSKHTVRNQPLNQKLSTIKDSGNLNLSPITDRRSNIRVILFSAKGKQFTQRDAERLTQYDRLIMICGRYEGVDERVAEYLVDEELSIGKYILTGGEIPAMVVIDSVTRLLPGVLGNEDSLREESYSANKELKKRSNPQMMNSAPRYRTREYPHYTRPEEFNGWKVPEVLLSGNHKEIEKWRDKRRS